MPDEIETVRKLRDFHQAAINAWNHYSETGLHVTAEEADRWLADLESGNQTEAPKCHR